MSHWATTALEVGQDPALQGRIERGQRLVHQEQFRPAEQGPSQRDPLFLAAREVSRMPLQEAADLQGLNHAREVNAAFTRLPMPLSIPQVALDGQVREQQAVLKNDAHGAILHRDAYARSRIEERAVSPPHPPFLRPDEARND